MAEASRDFDFIVIGSGFGGSVSAHRLTEKGYRVAVMEMGRRWTPENLPRTNWLLWRWIWRPRLALRGFFNIRPIPACAYPAWLRRGRRLHYLRQYVAGSPRLYLGLGFLGRPGRLEARNAVLLRNRYPNARRRSEPDSGSGRPHSKARSRRVRRRGHLLSHQGGGLSSERKVRLEARPIQTPTSAAKGPSARPALVAAAA